MHMGIDYLGMYKVFLDLESPENDLDVIEELSNNLSAIEAIARSSDSERILGAVDDTTTVYLAQATSLAIDLLEVIEPLCEDFLGISTEARQALQKMLPEFLIAAGIIMYKCEGYEELAEQYATTNSIDTSKLELPREMLEHISTDMTRVIDTIKTIFTVFKQFGAYFAEYQISDSDDLAQVISKLEDAGYATIDIGNLSEERVKAILSTI